MAEYVEGTMAEANLRITEWEENWKALKDLVTRAKGDTVWMINTVVKLLKDTGTNQADYEAFKVVEKEWWLQPEDPPTPE